MAPREIRETLERYQETTPGRLDLGPAVARTTRVEERAAEVHRLLDALCPEPLPERAAAINRALQEMDRELVLIDFTA
jgi:hypothetical protein